MVGLSKKSGPRGGASVPKRFAAIDFDSRRLHIVCANRKRNGARFQQLTQADIPENIDTSDAKALGAFLGKTADDVVFNFGGPAAHFGAAGVWYALSAANRDELNKDRAWTMLKALSVTGTSTMALKLLRNNETPNDKALAWPSGHTSSSFTVAAVLDEFYGPEVGIPAYLGAGFVGYRMMESGDHWASDVLFGATLGYIVGHHVAGKDKKLEVGGFDVIPLMGVLDGETGRTMTGVGFVRQF